MRHMAKSRKTESERNSKNSKKINLKISTFRERLEAASINKNEILLKKIKIKKPSSWDITNYNN